MEEFSQELPDLSGAAVRSGAAAGQEWKFHNGTAPDAHSHPNLMDKLAIAHEQGASQPKAASIGDDERADWDATYKTGVKPWSWRVHPNQPSEIICNAMQEELNELRPIARATRTALTDAQITAGSNILCDCPEPKRIGRNAAIDVFQAMGGVVQQEEVLSLHRRLAAETLRADQGWERYESANKDRNALRAVAAPQPVAAAQAVPVNLSSVEQALKSSMFNACRSIMGTNTYLQDDALRRALLNFSASSSPAAQAVPEAMVSAAGRALADLGAEACGINKDDNWKVYGNGFIEDARVAFKAAGFSIDTTREA